MVRRSGPTLGRGRRLAGAVLVGLATGSAPAMACPDCAAGVRAQVRRGIFDNSFAANLAATLAPFGVFLGVAAAVHSRDGRPGGNQP